MKSIVEGFIREVVEVMEALGRPSNNVVVNPSILTYTLLVLAFITGYSKSLIVPLIVLVYSGVLTVVLRVDLKSTLKPLTIVTVFSLISALPLLYSETGYVEGLEDFTSTFSLQGAFSLTRFILRVLASAYTVTLLIASLGWLKVLDSLGKGPLKGLVGVLKLFLTVTPQILKFMLSLLLVREARSFKKGRVKSWKELATSTGGLLLVSKEYSQKLTLCIEARNFNCERLEKTTRERLNVNYLDVFLTISFVTILTSYFMVEVNVGFGS